MLKKYEKLVNLLKKKLKRCSINTTYTINSINSN